MRLPFKDLKQPITSTDRGEGSGAFGVCEEREISITYCGLLEDRREPTFMVLHTKLPLSIYVDLFIVSNTIPETLTTKTG